MSAPPALPAIGGLGSPCPVPARTVRVGVVPRPRMRPLHEVLAATPPPGTARPEPAAADLADLTDLDDLTAVAEAARPAALSLFRVLAEILDGRRPITHLRPLCADGLYAQATTALVADHPSARRSPGRIRGVRVCVVGPTAAEASAVVHRDDRARALAARLERTGRRWWLAALVVG